MDYNAFLVSPIEIFLDVRRVLTDHLFAIEVAAPFRDTGKESIS